MKGVSYNVFSEGFYNKANISSVLNSVFMYSIIVGSCFIKLPQLTKIISNKTVAGLSFVSVYTEIFVATSLIVFSIKRQIRIGLYLDIIFINSQNIVIVFFMWKYSNAYSKCIQFLKTGFYVLFALFLLFGLPDALVPLLGLVAAPISCFSKLPQIYLNQKNQNTGNLSFLTYVFVLFGNLARLFTIFFNLNSKIFLINCGIVSSLNLTILLQVKLENWKESNTMQFYTRPVCPSAPVAYCPLCITLFSHPNV
ncbi:conserved Plasmodium protein, unknown function [Plasmodium ovale]|uniref:PQ-loop repeat-containing protein n=1 Tax=Plasmodium ovale TaxID=36330 RepID=A0A1D3TID0_PLAOA|nr:conserved Plasmodium protein, unknown function [Plasmodium ovale]